MRIVQRRLPARLRPISRLPRPPGGRPSPTLLCPPLDRAGRLQATPTAVPQDGPPQEGLTCQAPPTPTRTARTITCRTAPARPSRPGGRCSAGSTRCRATGPSRSSASWSAPAPWRSGPSRCPSPARASSGSAGRARRRSTSASACRSRRAAGPAFDYLHLHYRNAGVMLAMGMPMVEHMRQMAMTATDRHSRGRNFVGHYAVPEWNVAAGHQRDRGPVRDGPGHGPGAEAARRRRGVGRRSAATPGTAEGDFTSCMVWATRPGERAAGPDGGDQQRVRHLDPGQERSTPSGHIADRGEPFGIPGEVVDGNDPVATWHALERAFDYCRTTRRPYLLEALVSAGCTGTRRRAGRRGCRTSRTACGCSSGSSSGTG